MILVRISQLHLSYILRLGSSQQHIIKPLKACCTSGLPHNIKNHIYQSEQPVTHHVVVAVSQINLSFSCLCFTQEKREIQSSYYKLLQSLLLLFHSDFYLVPQTLSQPCSNESNYPISFLSLCLIFHSSSSVSLARHTNGIYSYYNSLSPKTRLMVGGGLIGYATLGLFLSDTAEEKLGYTPTEEDKKRLREAMPRIRVVEE